MQNLFLSFSPDLTSKWHRGKENSLSWWWGWRSHRAFSVLLTFLESVILLWIPGYPTLDTLDTWRKHSKSAVPLFMPQVPAFPSPSGWRFLSHGFLELFIADDGGGVRGGSLLSCLCAFAYILLFPSSLTGLDRFAKTVTLQLYLENVLAVVFFPQIFQISQERARGSPQAPCLSEVEKFDNLKWSHIILMLFEGST